ncbi:hypothetical protein L7F22_009684 [Adiantum nelumboides]|nr:hypothetical protein [Adiantum nelumboides]
MSSATGPVVYWCHLCNVETRPPVGDDVLCTFCNQGFIEELHSTEVEPGVAFSTLPLHFSTFLRRPSPTSVGITRDRFMTDSPSSSPLPRQQSASGQNQTDPQGHRPRILSGQLSGVPSLLEAMMQVLEEMNGPASRSASGNLEERASHGASGPVDPGLSEASEDSLRRGEALPQIHSHASEEDVHALFFPPTLILHGGAPNGFGTLEVFIDHGQGMGPQMLPNHMRDYFFGPDLDRLIQTLAENNPNRYGTPPAAKSEVEKLPKIKITEEHLASELFLECPVCKDDFELHAEVQQMPCKHIYHPDCILPWLAQHNSCPICRFELPTDDAEYEARKGQSSPGNVNVNTLPRQRSDVRSGANAAESEGSHGSDQESPRNENAVPPQFTLWGMPAIGFDTVRLSSLGLNPFTQTENQLNQSRQSGSGQEQGASREDGGTPVQWLFRLFSSGNLSSRDNANSGDQSPNNGNTRDVSDS